MQRPIHCHEWIVRPSARSPVLVVALDIPPRFVRIVGPASGQTRQAVILVLPNQHEGLCKGWYRLRTEKRSRYSLRGPSLQAPDIRAPMLLPCVAVGSFHQIVAGVTA
jgi:hypothetical protein